MPRNKNTSVKREVKKKSFFSQIKWGESYVSLLIGLIVVVVIAGLGISFVRSQKTTQTSSTQFNPSLQIQEEQNAGENNTQKTYTIKPGDDLWRISESFYKSGYNWIDIVKANNLKNPGMIFAGNKLIIPKVEPKAVTVSIQQEISRSIAGNSYTIEKGDNLWEIAVRAYGDGYSWTRIAQANSLDNPNLIFSGNVLKIPR